jgi:hypothetical protein
MEGFWKVRNDFERGVRGAVEGEGMGRADFEVFCSKVRKA